MNIAPRLIIGAVIAGVMAACGGGGTSTQTTKASQGSTPLSALTCSTILKSGNTATADIASLVSDQESQDKTLEQNWVNLMNGNLTSQGQDLQNAVGDFTAYTSGSQLASDAASFVSDAETFMNDQSGGLLPGWVSEYRLIQRDLHNLGADCGVSYLVPPGE